MTPAEYERRRTDRMAQLIRHAETYRAIERIVFRSPGRHATTRKVRDTLTGIVHDSARLAAEATGWSERSVSKVALRSQRDGVTRRWAYVAADAKNRRTLKRKAA